MTALDASVAPSLALVVAVAENGVIGRDGGLAWRISDDLKWFKKVTLGKPMIMGRKTFDSIGRPLPGRDNIVVSRTPGFAPAGVIPAAGLDEALSLGAARAKALGVDEICVIGGASLYAAALPRAARIYYTHVCAAPEGDVFFPPFELQPDPAIWRRASVGTAAAGPKNDHDCEFFIFDRVQSSDKTNAV